MRRILRRSSVEWTVDSNNNPQHHIFWSLLKGTKAAFMPRTVWGGVLCSREKFLPCFKAGFASLNLNSLVTKNGNTSKNLKFSPLKLLFSILFYVIYLISPSGKYYIYRELVYRTIPVYIYLTHEDPLFLALSPLPPKSYFIFNI